MDERWTLSPPGSFLGQIVEEEFRRRNLDYPKATVTSISIYMRLTLLASGKYLTMLPVSNLRHPTDKAWLRALPVKFEDTPGSVARHNPQASPRQRYGRVVSARQPRRGLGYPIAKLHSAAATVARRDGPV
jgi:hypothetical protein